MKAIQIGILGFGTVGTGVIRMLFNNADLIRSRIGMPLELKRVADIDTDTDRGVRLPEGMLTSDARMVTDDPEIDIVLELIGGEGIANDLILRAIQNKKHVVTANKALLSHKGQVLFDAAEESGVSLAYEASVGGCMPIIKTLREALVGDRVGSMIGILNGTCNFILTRMTDEGVDYETVLKEAQDRGFAEADPTLDVEGLDTAHKLAIINSLAYGMDINLNDIFIEGISKITPMDIEFARTFGYKIKLLAIGKFNGRSVEARVHPTMITSDNPLSSVNGSLNAVSITGEAVGNMMLYGHGAGMMPTATAVIGDIVDIARDIRSGARKRISLLAYCREHIRQIPIMPLDDISMNYYIRFSALDRPGVLSKISGILGNNNISIKSVHQKERKSKGAVPIVMLTHSAKESAIKTAMDEIVHLDVVSDRPIVIRIEDDNNEE